MHRVLPVLVLSVCAAAAARERGGDAGVDLSQRYRPPAWLGRTRVNIPVQKLTEKKWGGLVVLNEMENLSLGMLKDERRFRENIAKIHLAERANREQPWHVHTLMTLGLYYEALLSDLPRAYHFYGLAFEESGNHKMRDAPTHGPRPLKNWALVARARVMAMAGDLEGARKLLASASLSDWRDMLDAARVYQTLGEVKRSTAATVAAAASSGGNAFRRALCLGRSVLIFCENGELEQARKTFSKLEGVLARMSAKERKQGDVASTHRAASEVIKALEDTKQVDLSKLRNGTHTGQAYAYSGPLVVSVSVSKSRIRTVTVTSHKEKRPFNAISAVPARIVAAQKLRVDAVTGATVTSRAVERAVRDALSKAVRR